jgi:hypothetical protein
LRKIGKRLPLGLRAVRGFLFRACVLRVVLPLERTVAAQRYETEGKQLARLFIPLLKERGPEPYRKFVDFEIQSLTRKVMPEFVDRHHSQQNNYRQHHAADTFHYACKTQ